MNWDISNYDDSYLDKLKIPVLLSVNDERVGTSDWYKALTDIGRTITRYPDIIYIRVSTTTMDDFWLFKTNEVKRFKSKRRWIRGTDY